jgi:hypothetical protein
MEIIQLQKYQVYKHAYGDSMVTQMSNLLTCLWKLYGYADINFIAMPVEIYGFTDAKCINARTVILWLQRCEVYKHACGDYTDTLI